jgi:hypothetical protein
MPKGKRAATANVAGSANGIFKNHLVPSSCAHVILCRKKLKLKRAHEKLWRI